MHLPDRHVAVATHLKMLHENMAVAQGNPPSNRLPRTARPRRKHQGAFLRPRQCVVAQGCGVRSPLPRPCRQSERDAGRWCVIRAAMVLRQSGLRARGAGQYNIATSAIGTRSTSFGVKHKVAWSCALRGWLDECSLESTLGSTLIGGMTSHQGLSTRQEHRPLQHQSLSGRRSTSWCLESLWRSLEAAIHPQLQKQMRDCCGVVERI